jgi:hypothetical protein
MLHLTKLAVGVRDVPHLRDLQAARAEATPPLRHLTRSFPRRAAEILDGGSMYWVVAGAMIVRQRILGIAEDRRQDGTPCTALLLDSTLVPVLGRPMKPFQGWRYLQAADAPADLRGPSGVEGADELPAELLRELRALCLL